jgi:hypothetical protein
MRRLAALALASFALTACNAPAGDAAHADHADHSAHGAADAKAGAPVTADAAAAHKDGEHGEHVAAADGANPHAGCPHKEGEGDDSCASPPAPAAGASHYGAEFTTTEPVALASAIGDVANLTDKTVQVRGEVDAVCQMKGCWMVIKDTEDATKTARILMKDHSFSVPMDSKGKKALVEGTLTSKTFDEKQVKHLEKDGGGDPEKVSGERTEYVLTATGVKFES